MRATLGLLAGAAAGALGAVILGEYNYKGWTVLASGILFGILIAEAILAAAKSPSPLLGIGGAVIGLAAMTWGAWIGSGHDLSFLGPAGWSSIVLTGAFAGARAGGLTARLTPRRRGSRPEEPAPAASPEGQTP